MKQSDELRLKRLAKEREAAKAKKEQEASESKALTEALEKLSTQIGEMESISIPEPKDLEPKLDEVNATLVQLIELMTSGIEIRNIGEAKAKKLEIANQIQIPKDLATNKAVEGIAKAIEQNKVVLQAIAKAAEAQSQKPEDFIPVRRVYKAGNRFLFDDSSTGSYSGGGGGGGAGSGGNGNNGSTSTAGTGGSSGNGSSTAGSNGRNGDGSSNPPAAAGAPSGGGGAAVGGGAGGSGRIEIKWTDPVTFMPRAVVFLNQTIKKASTI